MNGTSLLFKELPSPVTFRIGASVRTVDGLRWILGVDGWIVVSDDRQWRRICRLDNRQMKQGVRNRRKLRAILVGLEEGLAAT